MSTMLKELLIQYCASMREGAAATFIGAGMSGAVGLPDWKGLIAHCVESLNLKIERENDLPAVTQYFLNRRGGNRAYLNHLVAREFDKPTDITERHRIIVRLPIPTIWTTNFDRIIESAFFAADRQIDIRRADSDFAKGRRHDVVLNKMHGDVDRPHKVVLSESDYERYAKTHPIFQNALEGDLITKTFLFLGFSFTDPNLKYMLGHLGSLLGDSKRIHYAIMRKARLNWDDEKAEEEFEYEFNRQQLQVDNLMRRYGIQTLLVDDFDQVDKVLNALELTYRRKTVFVSGGSFGTGALGPERLKRLCRQLGARLIESGFSLAADFRTDVGCALLDGAMQMLTEKRLSPIDKYLVRALPRNLPPNATQTSFDQECRKAMVNKAGFVVFVGDNQSENGELDFDLRVATAHGTKTDRAIPIPIGASGSAAFCVWDAVRVSRAYENLISDNEFQLLNSDALDDSKLVEAVFAIIDKVSDRVPDIRSKHAGSIMNEEFYLSLKKQFPNLSPEERRTIMAEVDAKARAKTDSEDDQAKTTTAEH
jgi:hypothetical protein